MQNLYRIGFRTIFLVGVSHLLLVVFFLIAKTPLRPAHKTILVKSFSAPSVFQERTPLAKPTKETQKPTLESIVPKERMSAAVKEMPKKEIIEKKENTIPSEKKTTSLKKYSPKLASESFKKSGLVQKKNLQEKVSRSGERPKVRPKEEGSRPPLQREYAESLVKEIEKNIAFLAHPSGKQSSWAEIKVPSYVQPSSLEAKVENAPFSSNESSVYQDRLIQDLKNNLKLPEYGEVKLLVRISSKGDVIKAEVLSSRSERNKGYLQKELLRLQFAWFPQVLSEAPFYDFVITFQNENP